MALTYANIPAGGSVTLDPGTALTVFVQNVGNRHCLVLPSGVRLSSGENATIPVSADVPVSVDSAAGTTVGYSVSGSQPGGLSTTAIDCGSSS